MVPSEEFLKIKLAKAIGDPESSVTIPPTLVCEKTIQEEIRKKKIRNFLMF